MANPITLTTADLIRELSQACEQGQSAWAAKHGIARSVVSDVLAGRRDPSEAVINALGYFRVVRYVPVRKPGLRSARSVVLSPGRPFPLALSSADWRASSAVPR